MVLYRKYEGKVKVKLLEAFFDFITGLISNREAETACRALQKITLNEIRGKEKILNQRLSQGERVGAS